MADISGNHRKSFSVRFKQQVISAVEDLIKSGLSICQATDQLQIHIGIMPPEWIIFSRKVKHTRLEVVETSKNFIRVV